VELNISLPLWTKVFKTLNIYNEDYHDKYRKHIREKRYAEYIKLVLEDINNRIIETKKQIKDEKFKEIFPEPEYKIIYPK
jgi:uncharacterized membrane-anchored protein